MRGLLGAVLAVAGVAACAPTQNTAGVAVREIPQGERGPVAGVGIEGSDIMAMTDRMMRNMLQSPVLAGAGVPPQVIVDGEYFVNESAQRINKNTIADRLRVNLNRTANGRMIFVARHNAAMVEQERTLKRDGKVDVGTTGLTRAAAGADYRLSGRISSVDAVNVGSGMTQRYNQIIFEMVDLERGTIVWSNIYEFTRAAADDVVYR
ncbi:MAG: membrane protein [Rhodospirillaceae bacterium BRH_c57]|nr:MAG: membrane protein [Rhodospirillaceae bacterium BRH_c57]